ncbi:MAG: HAD family hydrolase [Candidatus Omnitrophota bacterium]
MSEDRVKTKRSTPALMSRRRGRIYAKRLTILVLVQVMLLSNAVFAGGEECLAPVIQISRTQLASCFNNLSEIKGVYADLAGFSCNYKIGPLTGGADIYRTAHEIVEKELPAAVYAIDTLVQIRNWMDENGASERPLIIWQNLSVGQFYPYMTEKLKERLGVMELSEAHMHQHLLWGKPIFEGQNPRFILIKKKLASIDPDCSVISEDMRRLGQEYRAPIVMIDNSEHPCSGAQLYVHKVEDKASRENILINMLNKDQWKHRPGLLEEDTFFFTLNTNQTPSRTFLGGKVSDFDDFRIKNQEVLIGGEKVKVVEVLINLFGAAVDRVMSGSDRMFASEKTLVWDFDDTVYGSQTGWRPGVSESFLRLKKRGGRHVFATLMSEDHVQGIFDMTGLRLPYNSIFGGDKLGVHDHWGVKYYEFLLRRVRLASEQAKANMVIIGNSETDMPRDMDDVVFIHVQDMSLAAENIEEVLMFLDEIGHGSFSNGFARLFEHGIAYDNGVKSCRMDGINFYLGYRTIETKEGRTVKIPVISDITRFIPGGVHLQRFYHTGRKPDQHLAEELIPAILRVTAKFKRREGRRPNIKETDENLPDKYKRSLGWLGKWLRETAERLGQTEPEFLEELGIDYKHGSPQKVDNAARLAEIEKIIINGDARSLKGIAEKMGLSVAGLQTWFYLQGTSLRKLKALSEKSVLLINQAI